MKREEIHFEAIIRPLNYSGSYLVEMRFRALVQIIWVGCLDHFEI